MGTKQAAYWEKDTSTRFYMHDEANRLDKEAEAWIDSAMKLAEKLISKQEKLLMRMADYLSDNRHMTKKQISEYIAQYAVDFDMSSLIENGDHLFYRKCLKEKVNTSLPEKTNANDIINSIQISLNKNE